MKGSNLTASPGQRVVLAVQGGGQILLPANFQGSSINLKQMQGGQSIKMIPVQTSQIQSTISKCCVPFYLALSWLFFDSHVNLTLIFLYILTLFYFHFQMRKQ